MANTRRWREEVRWKVLAWVGAWRALDKSTRWTIALGSLGFAACSLTVSGYFVFFYKGSGSGIESNLDVTLYTSTDEFLLGPILEKFETDTGLKVRVVGDTEATKTTGLVHRLIEESQRKEPRCDVWWSNEALGTVTLANSGILEPFASKQEALLGAAWPRHLRGEDRRWYGFAQRARVIAFNTNRVARPNAPKTLRDLTRAEWAGKVGIARPQFGTTRTHVSALVAMHGEEAVREWLAALQNNAVRVYDSNSAVVQGLSVGEIEVGLTDSDDVMSGQRNQWPVDMVFEAADKPGKVTGLPSLGSVVIPNTVGLVRGGPHPNEARRLMDYLLSAEVERALATSDSRNIPIRPALAKELGSLTVVDAAPASPEDCAKAMDAADALIAEFFPLK